MHLRECEKKCLKQKNYTIEESFGLLRTLALRSNIEVLTIHTESLPNV